MHGLLYQEPIYIFQLLWLTLKSQKTENFELKLNLSVKVDRNKAGI